MGNKLTTTEKRAYLDKVLAHILEVNKISLNMIQAISNSSLSEEDSKDLLSIAEEFQGKTFNLIHNRNLLVDMEAKEIEEAIEILGSQKEQLLGLLEELSNLDKIKKEEG